MSSKEGAFFDQKGRCHRADGKFTYSEECARSMSPKSREIYLRYHNMTNEKDNRYFQDTKGRCHEEDGKFARSEYCERSPRKNTSPRRQRKETTEGYFRDSQGRCRNNLGQYASDYLCR